MSCEKSFQMTISNKKGINKAKALLKVNSQIEESTTNDSVKWNSIKYNKALRDGKIVQKPNKNQSDNHTQQTSVLSSIWK